MLGVAEATRAIEVNNLRRIMACLGNSESKKDVDDACEHEEKRLRSTLRVRVAQSRISISSVQSVPSKVAEITRHCRGEKRLDLIR
ncbi:hypothetical protein R1flu_007513 [Riccia fluitans]|uniref:Uncharacterized protein n=1 Tax=Riccia fluitans TaxID=41844 RepID=A0ABD1YZ25_9MARC